MTRCCAALRLGFSIAWMEHLGLPADDSQFQHALHPEQQWRSGANWACLQLSWHARLQRSR